MNKSFIIDAMKYRRAVKNFDPSKKIFQQDLDIILESARLSPSSFGLQPWKINVIDDQNLKEKIFPIAFNQSQITSCSHLFVICGLNDIDEMYINNFVDRSKNSGGDLERLEMYRWMLLRNIHSMKENWTLKSYIDNQTYIMLGNIITTSALLWIDSAPMGWFNKEELDTLLWLTEQWVHSVILCALGQRSDEDKRSKTQKFRFEMNEIIL